MKNQLEEANFEDVEEMESPVPVGTWPKDPKLKEIGRYFRAQLSDGAVESYSLALFTRFGKWTSAEMQVLLARLRSELRMNKMHVYARMYVLPLSLLSSWTAKLIENRGFYTARKAQ